MERQDVTGEEYAELLAEAFEEQELDELTRLQLETRLNRLRTDFGDKLFNAGNLDDEVKAIREGPLNEVIPKSLSMGSVVTGEGVSSGAYPRKRRRGKRGPGGNSRN